MSGQAGRDVEAAGRIRCLSWGGLTDEAERVTMRSSPISAPLSLSINHPSIVPGSTASTFTMEDIVFFTI